MFWELHPELSGNWQDDDKVIKNINYDTVLGTEPNIEYKEPYCIECGSDDLSYIEQYANGCEYECKECSNKFMW